jgi:DNA-binding NarL/FixJ family response regulator
MRSAKVLLADDHTIVAAGLSSLLKERFDLVGVVGDGKKLVEMVGKLRPDVVVSDIGMPVLSGLDALRRLRAEGVDTRFIFLTMHDDAQLATEAFRAGASGFLLKQSAGDELIAAIEEVLHGRTYLTPLITKDVIHTLTAPPAEPLQKLTPRQREVLRLIADGKRLKEIAAMLHLSTRTVETHKYDMMHALQVESTAELIRYAIRNGLIDPLPAS